MAPTIFIKFCGLRVHSEPNNIILANLPEKIPETGKIFILIFFRLLTQGLNQLINLVQTRYSLHSKPNNMTYRVSRKKSLKLEK